MPRSFDKRHFPIGPEAGPPPTEGGRGSSPLRGRKRLGPIGAIVPGDHVEVARELARLRKPRWKRPKRIATLHIKVYPDDETVGVGDGRFKFPIAEDMDDMTLERVEIHVTTVSSSGIVQVQIRNVTDVVDMLSTRIQIDANEKNSKDASTEYVINPANASVSWGEEISIDIDQAGSGAMGLVAILEFVF